MNRALLATLLMLLLSSALFASSLKGRVVNAQNEGVPYATIYIHELSTGFATDSDGFFLYKMAPGSYTVEVSSLGYKRVKLKIEIGTVVKENIIKLEEEHYQLGVLYFKATGENRANYVMRQAIAKAPYYRSLVSSYVSEVYLKGSIKITKIPALLRMQAGKSKTKLIVGNKFIVESKSKIEYSSPNNYKERVIAFTSTLPSELDVVNQISAVNTSSLYESDFFGKLSPLAPDAFRYYKFVYEGISNDQGYIVNKIRVIPKKGDSKLLSGHIYIVDDLWSISSAHLLLKETGVDANLKINYHETSPNILMPTSYLMDLKISIMGVNAEGLYNSSITYNSVSTKEEQLSSNLQVATTPTTTTSTTSVSKQERDEIAEANNSSSQAKRSAERLELLTSDNITKTIDSLALSRDSSYWNSVRAIPLTTDERLSYQNADSLQKEFTLLEENNASVAIKRTTGNLVVDKVLYGGRHKVGEKLTLGYGGLLRVVGGFTFTDGLWLGQNFYSSFKIGERSRLTFEPSLYYSTARERLMWRGDLALNYSPMRLGEATLSFGSFSRDINDNSTISDFIASYGSFLFGLNPKIYHSQQWIEATNKIDLANGLNLGLSAKWSELTPLTIARVKPIWGKAPADNIPENLEGNQFLPHSNFEFGANISYTPNYYYKISNGVKRYVRSSWPTFSLAYYGALDLGEHYSEWGRVVLSAAHRIRDGLYSQYIYNIEGGFYLNKKRLFFDNLHHFNASNLTLLEKGFANDFTLMPQYRYSTSSNWMRYSLEYRSNYILLNYLPFLNSALYVESLYCKGVWVPERKNVFNELGYAFGIHGTLKIGFFVAFEGNSLYGGALRLELPFIKDLYR